jgi:hypothetical protein
VCRTWKQKSGTSLVLLLSIAGPVRARDLNLIPSARRTLTVAILSVKLLYPVLIAAVFNYLHTTPLRRMGERKYSSTVLEGDTR